MTSDAKGRRARATRETAPVDGPPVEGRTSVHEQVQALPERLARGRRLPARDKLGQLGRSDLLRLLADLGEPDADSLPAPDTLSLNELRDRIERRLGQGRPS